MPGQRFYAEDFRRIMPSQNEVDSQFLSGHGGPVRRFPGNESVNIFPGDPVNF